MIDWNQDSVESVLKVAPAVERTMLSGVHPELVFRFDVNSLRAELRIRPFQEECSLTLQSTQNEEVASWFYACSRIQILEDDDDQSYLLLEAPSAEGRLRSWIAVAPEGSSFRVYSSAVVLPPK